MWWNILDYINWETLVYIIFPIVTLILSVIGFITVLKWIF